MAEHAGGWQTFFRVSRVIGFVLMWIAYIVLALWCIGAIAYAPYPEWICIIGNILFILLILSAPLIKPRLNFICAAFMLMISIVICWQFIRPSDNRIWQPGFEKVPEIKWTDQDTFTIRNMRDCRYISDKEFHTFYREGTYKISRVTSVKFISVYWEQKFEREVAHSMIAFSFSDGRILVFSFERRCSKYSEYGSIPSLYKQSEICCVISEPTDILALRTHFRAQPEGEQVYMYELDLTPEQRRSILRDVVMEAGELSRDAEFFNTAVNNCATKLLDALDETLDLSDWHYSFLLNGFLDRYLFDHGFVVKKYDSETFEEVRSRSLLNGHVKQYWKGYDPKRIADPAYRDDSYSKLLFEYYGK